MKTNSFFIYFLGIFSSIVLSNCEHQKSDVTTETIKKVIDLDELKEQHFYGFLSLEGCNTCLEQSLSFVKQHLNEQEISFFISTSSPKKARLIFTKEQLTSSNLHILDVPLVSDMHGLTQSNFSIYFIKNEVVKKQWITSPITIQESLAEINRLILNEQL